MATSLFTVASDCRPETASAKAEELVAVALCAQIPFSVMAETIAISESERRQLDFLAFRGIVPQLLLETHINFRLQVLAHFRALVKAHEEAERSGPAVSLVSPNVRKLAAGANARQELSA